MKFNYRTISQLPLIFALSLNVILANPAHSQEPTESKTTASGLSMGLGKGDGGAGAGSSSSSSSKKRKLVGEDGESDSSSESKTKKAKTEAATDPLQKINDYLYVGKKDGIYFVMERIDKGVPDSGDRLKFWKKYTRDEMDSYDNYKELWIEGKVPKEKGFLQFEDEDDELNYGHGSFEISIKWFHSDNELWVCYVTSKEIKSASEISEHEIEMVVSVLTTEESPFVTHIGITRSFRYLSEAAEEVAKVTNKSAEGFESKGPKVQIETERKFPLHPNLSINLHAFAAKVMKMRDASKVYMITCPIDVMRDILTKALPGHIFAGDTFERASKIVRNSKDSSVIHYLDFEIVTLEKELDQLDAEEMSLKIALWLSPNNGEKKHQTKNLPKKELKRKLKDIGSKKSLIRSSLNAAHKRVKTYAIPFHAQTLEVTPKTSPIRRTEDWIEIFDKERKAVIYRHDFKSNEITVKGQVLRGDETRRFGWFRHSDMNLNINEYFTVHLDELAKMFDREQLPRKTK